MNPTGVFFKEQTVESICKAVVKFEEVKNKINPKICKANAERFSNERFLREIKEVINTKM